MCKCRDKRVDISGMTDEIALNEFNRLNRSFEFYLDFGLKAVAFFYAAVGAVLSIYFGGSSKTNNAVGILLGIPILISLILGGRFVYGAILWHKHTVYLSQLAEKLHIERPRMSSF